MKLHMSPTFIVTQLFYGLLGLTFLALLFGSTYAHSEVATITGDKVTVTGEITSIEGDGFAMEHDNGITLISLREIEPDEKATLQDAQLIKVGNMVTVTGEMDKGNFNKPVLSASKLSIVEKLEKPKPVETSQ